MKNSTYTPYNRYRKTLAWIGFVVVYVLIPLVIVLVLSNQRDRQLSVLADCIHQKAIEQGYAGDIYGPEAWQLFVISC